jgi:hypothetical protein
MRSITFVQAFQYWLKLTALLLPLAVLLVVWSGDGRPAATSGADSWSVPLADGGAQGLYLTYSLIIATFLGTMGLPHVVVRFYTNPDGRAARRTTLVVLVLLGVFYLLPPLYGALGRVYAPELAAEGSSDVLVLELPRLMVDGPLGELLTGLVTAGAFAAFLSTSSGLTIAVAGVLSQDVTGRGYAGRRLGGVTAFRMAAVLAVAVPCLVALASPDLGVARAVGLAFAVAASTFCPLLLLGIWWHGARRGPGLGLRRGMDTRARAGRGLARRAAQPAGRLERAAGAGHDGHGQPGDPWPPAGAHPAVHGPAAHPRGGRAGPRLSRSPVSSPAPFTGAVRRTIPTARRSVVPARRTVRAHPSHPPPARSYGDGHHTRTRGARGVLRDA